MSFDRKKEDVFITGTVSSAGFYGPFFGDGSGITNLPGGGGGGGLTGSGTANYVAKFTSAGVLADSNIQDNGYPNGVGINYAPQAGVILAIGNAVQPTTQYILNNYATSSTTKALQIVSIGPGTGSHIGIDIQVMTATNSYALKLQDGRQGTGKVLTSDVDGNAYWATSTGGGGGSQSLATTLLIGNTASTDIDMNQYQIQNVSVIDADGNVGIQTINMINASLLTLMYNT